MKSTTGMFFVGILVGVIGALAIERMRQGESPEDVEELTSKVRDHLQELEERLHRTMEAAH